VDIKAAYPTTLRNMGCIQDETFRWCMDNLKKPERLKSVGMLAGSKFVQHYRDGRLGEQYREDSALRPWFFDVCHYVGSVMADLSEHLDKRFLFFWVDGVFADLTNADEAVRYLGEFGYEATAERVSRIRWSRTGKYILFRKGGKDTYLCVPRKVETLDADLVADIERASGITNTRAANGTNTNLGYPSDIRKVQVPVPQGGIIDLDGCPF
jgi:hypothetical protein